MDSAFGFVWHGIPLLNVFLYVMCGFLISVFGIIYIQIAHCFANYCCLVLCFVFQMFKRFMVLSSSFLCCVVFCLSYIRHFVVCVNLFCVVFVFDDFSFLLVCLLASLFVVLSWFLLLCCCCYPYLLTYNMFLCLFLLCLLICLWSDFYPTSFTSCDTWNI